MKTDWEYQIRNIFGTSDLSVLTEIAEKAARYDAMQKHNARGAGRKGMFTENDAANMWSLHQQGKTVQEIASRYGTSRQTVSQYLQSMKTSLSHPGCTWRLNYMNGNQLCTAIYVDFRHEKIEIQNYTGKILLRAFGIQEHPDWKEFELFLRDRCLPESRANLKLLLREMNIPSFEPFAIIEKTQGRMAGDDQWIQMIPLNRTGKAARHGEH